jgi:hypothetical protein
MTLISTRGILSRARDSALNRTLTFILSLTGRGEEAPSRVARCAPWIARGRERPRIWVG